MAAIGIDIVDLLQAGKESNWQRPGFLEKLFSAEEQVLVQQAADPRLMVWLLWTMKEAAYKIYSREFQWHAFAPLQLSCKLLSCFSDRASGLVTCRNENYHTQTILSRDLVHTIAFSDEGMDKKVRVLILRNEGDSKSYIKTKPATVSHHGRYLALAYF